MIDVSYQSMQQGMVRILSQELHKLLDELPRDVGMSESVIKVGFVTYSTQLHFYNVKANLAQPQMLVVADLEDSFVPLLDGFLVDYREAKAVVDGLVLFVINYVLFILLVIFVMKYFQFHRHMLLLFFVLFFIEMSTFAY